MTILSTLIEISIYSAVLLLAILLLKKVLHKKLSAGVQFTLWSLFILRLLLPFSIDSGLHLVTYTEPIQPVAQVEDTVPTTNTSQEHGSIPMTFSDEPQTWPAHTETTKQQGIIEVAQDNETPQPAVSAPPTSLSPADIVTMVWLMGILVFLMFMGISYIKLRKRIMTRSTALIPSDVMALIQQCEQQMGIKHPCEVRISNDFGSTVLLAALRPKLIIPTHMLDNPVVLEHCLLHEFAHYRRRDYLTYLLTNLLCAVYWFNPCVWIGTRLMKQDMESACDALVIKTMNDNERDKYARTLLSMFSNQPKRFQIAMGMGIATKKEAEKRLRGVYMKRKTSVKTKLTVIVLALIMLMTCFTTACQPMEAENIDTQQAIETPVNTPTPSNTSKPVANTSEIPKHWTETVENGKLTINIDTDIKMPNTDQYPVVRVKPVVFSQERVDELVDYFAKDKKLYEWPRAMTKADYEKILVEVRKGDLVDGEYIVTEQTLEQIAELEQKKADAPVETPKIYTDTTLTAGNNPSIYTSSNISSLSVCVDNGNHDDAVIHVHNYSSGQNNETSFRYSKGNSYITESRINQMIEEGQVFDPDDQNTLNYCSMLTKILNNVQISADELKPYAKKILTDLNIQDMQLVNAEKAVLRSWYNHRGLDANTLNQGGYVFEYIRQSGGIPGFQKTWFSGPDKNPPKYTPPFIQEQVTVFVSEDGVQKFTWSGCAKVVETVSENIELLPFNQIQQALIDQIYNKHYFALEQESTITMNVNAAELRMGYINTDKPGEALMVPVWVFYTKDVGQNLDYETGEITTYEYNPDAITINAMDGGVIDRG